MASPTPAASRLTMTQWLVLALASIGFAFDIYELLMLPLIVRPALQELVGAAPGTPVFDRWVQLLFYVPAVAGGIFGLLGGYLTDRLGRRRVLTWSILIYAVSAFLAGYSTSPEMLLILRCTTFIGVCVEFVAAVAWLAELFPDPHQRERALGYTQAFSSFGGLLVAVANGLMIRYGISFFAIEVPEALQGMFGSIGIEGQHAAWRYTLMSGLIPAFPLLIIRPFLPESPVWQQKKQAGTLKRPSIAQLFAPEFRKTTIVTTIMFACSYGAAFGAIQHIPRIVPGLSDVQEEVKEAIAVSKTKLEMKKDADPKTLKVAFGQAKGKIEQRVGAEYTKMQEIGGLLGRFLLAALTVYVVSRRALLRIFQFPGLFLVPLIFYFFLDVENQTFFVINLEAIYLGHFPVTTMSLGALLAGLFTVAQFSFWGNYLPRVYPLHLRGTGESFAANIGGRMIGTSFAAVTVGLSSLIPDKYSPAQRLTWAAAAVALFVYLVGSIACFFLPEPATQELPD